MSFIKTKGQSPLWLQRIIIYLFFKNPVILTFKLTDKVAELMILMVTITIKINYSSKN
jgi:hypothetical protein